jgi:transcriptional regulator of acetoin/glycerol metabolism
VIFTEKSIGTNAVDLSIRLNKSVYVPAKDNYCDFLKTWDVFSVPLLNGEETMGYLAVIMPEKKISKEMIAVTGLLGYRIANEYTQGLKRDCRDKISGVRLTNRQLIILKHLACGKTDKPWP